MATTRTRLYAVAAAILVAVNACTTSGGRMTETAAIDELLRDYDGNVPGASVVVIDDGRVAFRKSYGLADLEERTAATPKTNYRLASVTKQFTAAAVMILAERGLLSYDDTITRHLPSLLYARDVTIRHLLTHTSGLVDYEDLITPATSEQLLDRDVLRLLESESRTYFAAGTDYRYSNSGYALLALIVERVSGESFAEFLKKEIFDPLAMRGSVAYEKGISSVEHRAYGYSHRDGTWIRTDQSPTSAVLGDGGIYASIDDLARWDAALREGRLLRPETWRLASRPSVATDEKGVHYGFGWRISEHRGRRMQWHSGETIGFRNVLIRFPGERLTVIVLTNRNEPPPYALALKIADLYL